ncbi:hypothetical protein [Dysgonomonas termitidis]|uniref:Uncharacterized protein n=1 Tax=Dysgonomonas termitidis TaxID=1516126 RepID=A0ABV9KTB2_9BACT
MDTIKTDSRQQAVDWLNTKERSIDKGLTILKEAGYKPFVVANFEKNRNRSDIPKKLLAEMRGYIRYCTNPDAGSPAHEDEPPLLDPETFIPQLEKELPEEYPAIVKRLVSEVRELYTARSLQHQALKTTGEGNDEKSNAERKRIGLIIDTASRRMDTLWKAFEAYKQDGTLPDEALFAEPFDPEKIAMEVLEPKKEEPTFTLPDDPEALKKMSENWRTKLAKAENRLEYQKDKKGAKPNPMPAGPKRIAQEKRVAQLREEKLAIDTKIAELK